MRVEVMSAAARSEPALPQMQASPYRRRRRARTSSGAGVDARAARPSASRRRRRSPAAERDPERSRDLGPRRPQRALPLRLRQEVQALPRPVRLREVGLRDGLTLNRVHIKTAVLGRPFSSSVRQRRGSHHRRASRQQFPRRHCCVVIAIWAVLTPAPAAWAAAALWRAAERCGLTAASLLAEDRASACRTARWVRAPGPAAAEAGLDAVVGRRRLRRAAEQIADHAQAEAAGLQANAVVGLAVRYRKWPRSRPRRPTVEAGAAGRAFGAGAIEAVVDTDAGAAATATGTTFGHPCAGLSR